MKHGFDIVVVGAGMTGLALAALLATGERRASFRITLVDAGPRPAFDPGADVALRVSAIAGGSATLLDALGAWKDIVATRACPYDRMRVWDEADDPAGASVLRFDADEFGRRELGHIVENVLVQDRLLRVLDAAATDLRFETPIAGLSAGHDRVRVDLEDGRNLDADLVVGADGVNSVVRRAMGIESSRWHYAQTALVTHLRPELPHRHTARQRFLGDGPLGMLPLADGRVSVVWSTAPEIAGRAANADDDELGRMLTAASDAVLGRLDVAGPRGSFPLGAQHARHYVLPRLALIGDAAHAVHPLAGQGANLGLADARVLAAVLDDAVGRGEHPGDRPVLRRYERARKGANAAMLHFLTGLNRLFASDSALVGGLRRAGMQLFNASGPVREYAVRVALGDQARQGAEMKAPNLRNRERV